MCSGCHACVNICPKQCISMSKNKEGFLYPVIDVGRCIECGLCNQVCHMQKSPQKQNIQCAYACYNLDETVRNESSSGGMFTLFAEQILDLGGVVFGAAFDANLEVRHIGIDTKEQLYKLRTSKYMQSIIGDTYKQAKALLEKKRPVLFTGTPCQISGLKMFFGKKYDTLYTQDIICHGVVSAKLWRMYLDYLEKQHKSKVDSGIIPSFRDKTFGWSSYSVKLHFENNTVYNVRHGNDLFIRTFLSDALLRHSCYKCKCKGVMRESDITLADFWGINNVMPNLFDDKGTSLVFVNSEKGKALFDNVKSKCVFVDTDVNAAIKYNPSAYSSPVRPSKRKKLTKNMHRLDFETLQRKCIKKNYLEKGYRKVKGILQFKVNGRLK